ncbi:hypothetical protein IM40_09545 (plasmid) [Candidatus Paracaedimonas acanthamoebae]|nr:hypothetical protein IM40_09545 [Candidatus Paracaedimonas acanthamoebae]
MAGMDAETGKLIEGLDHLKQSILDILKTPLGSRVMRRDYGSRIFSMLDQPINQELILQLQASVAEALTTYEPRLRLSRVKVDSRGPGEILIKIEGYHAVDGQPINLSERIEMMN